MRFPPSVYSTMVYLDHAATTPLDPRVLEVMLPFLREDFGNASSVHALGRRARFAIEDARERIASLLGAASSELIFTSGATESNNTALAGVMAAQGSECPRFVTSPTEHEAILQPAERMKSSGHPLTLIGPENDGRPGPARLAAALDSDVGLVSLMAVNNETGSVNPVEELAAVCRDRGIPFHCDAVQAAGWTELKVSRWGVDLLSLSAHKVYGPKGVGLLYVRNGTPFDAVMLGGAQERRRRGGTENVAAIIGFARALELAETERDERRNRVTSLHRRLRAAIEALVPGPHQFNSLPPDDHRAAPHILTISFPPADGRVVDGEMLLLGLDMEGILVSSGSACTSGAIEPSHVLLALGIERSTAAATVRFSLGKDTTEGEVDLAADKLSSVVRRLRRLV